MDVLPEGMDMLSGTAMILIILLVVAFLGAAGYILWFAITHGLLSAFETDINSMIAQAEKNANALAGIMSREFNTIESQIVGTYQTVSAALVEAANTVKAKGDDAITQITSGANTAISEVERTFTTVGNQVNITTQNAIDTIKTTSTDTIDTIKRNAATQINLIENEFNKVKSRLTTTGGTISTESKAVLRTMRDQMTSAFTVIKQATLTGYETVQTNVNTGVQQITSGANTAANQVTATTQTIVQNIQRGGDTAISTVTDTYTNVISQIQTGSVTLGQQIATGATNVAGQVATGATGAYTTVASALGTAAGTVKDTGKSITDVVYAEGQNTIGILTTATSEAKAAATTAINEITSKTGTAITQINTAFTDASTAVQGATATVNRESNAAISTLTQNVEDSYVSLSTKAVNSFAAVRAATRSTAAQAVTQIRGVSTDFAASATKFTTDTTNTIRDGTLRLSQTIGATGATLTTTPAAGAQGFQNYREGFQSAEAPPPPIEQSLFFNLQAFSIKDTGFLGPYPRGSYKEEIATANALKAGCRFLTLQIDYTDMKMDLSLYEAPGVPTLLVRGPDGTLMSKNSGSIADVAATIANTAFTPIVPHNRLPIILYLHIVRAPNQLNDPDGYLSFLSQIADALNPIAPFHLGLNPQGNFTRQKMAEELLTMPMSSLESQIVVMCNADTSMFRRSSINKNKYPPAKDLDFWTNIRVYLDTEADLNGITQLADSSIQPAAVLVSLPRILSLSSANMDAFASRSKKRYVIAMGDRAKNPTVAQLDIALNRLGVNVVPLDIFTDTDRSIMLLANVHGNKPFTLKPTNLQYSA
jgi:hypothetical protein